MYFKIVLNLKDDKIHEIKSLCLYLNFMTFLEENNFILGLLRSNWIFPVYYCVFNVFIFVISCSIC